MASLIPIDRDARAARMPWLCERCDLTDFEGRLMRDEISAYQISGTDAALVLSVGTAADSGARGLWIESLGGVARYAPKANAKLIGSVIEDCTILAKGSGCSEIRIEAGTRTRLKLGLFARFGFEVLHLPETTLMRKAI